MKCPVCSHDATDHTYGEPIPADDEPASIWCNAEGCSCDDDARNFPSTMLNAVQHRT